MAGVHDEQFFVAHHCFLLQVLKKDLVKFAQ